MSRLLATLILAASLAPAAQADTPPPTARQIRATVADAVGFLRSRQRDDGQIPGGRQGSTTIAALALLAAGVHPASDKQLAKTLEWLAKQKPNNTYIRGLRANVWEYALRKDAKNQHWRDLLKADYDWLMKALGKRNGWRYTMGSRDWDNSCTQYGVLGIWAASRAGFDPGKAFWQKMSKHFLGCQNSDGGWGYSGRSGSTANMVTAGLASLFLVLDSHYGKQVFRKGQTRDFETGEGAKVLEAVRRGMKFLGARGGSSHAYYLYGIERTGVASGLKRIGGRDWFAEGAKVVVSRQQRDGSISLGYGPVISTSLCTLFLVYGGAPVAMMKLQHGETRDWNNNPRDLANLSKHLWAAYEAPVNWQAVSVDAAVGELEAPILFISGSKALKLDEEQMLRLREYVLRGGTILCEASDHSEAFTRSAEELAKQMFPPATYPDHALSALPADHPIYTVVPQKWDTRPALRGMSDGGRTFFLISDGYLSADWQSKSADADALKLATNLLFYATDMGALKGRFTSLLPQTASAAPREGVLRVARVRTSGNTSHPRDWDAAPRGWEIVAPYVRHVTGLTLQSQRPVRPGKDKLKDVHLLHLSGRRALVLTHAERQALKAYVAGGGTLLVDASAGSVDFARTAHAELSKIFGKLVALPDDSALCAGLFEGGEDLTSGIRLTLPARQRLRRRGDDSRGMQLEVAVVDGRPAVLFSEFDLSSAMADIACYRARAYRPSSARKIVANLLAYQRDTPPDESWARYYEQAPASAAPRVVDERPLEKKQRESTSLLILLFVLALAAVAGRRLGTAGVLLLAALAAAPAAEACFVRAPQPVQVWLDHVDVQITDQIATKSYRCAFKNPNPTAVVGGVCYMELEPGARVHGMRVAVAGKRAHAEILGVERANEVFADIVKRGGSPALLEYYSNQLIRTRLPRIAPGKTVTVELKYTMPLTLRGDLVRLQMLNTNPKAQMKALKAASVRVSIRSSKALKNIYSPTHDIKLVEKEGWDVVVEWAETDYLPKHPFVLYYQLASEAIGASLLAHREPGEDGHFMLMLSPTMGRGAPRDDQVLPKDVVLCVDCSGSMLEGGKMQQARQALAYCVGQLRPQDRFNIVDFSTGVRSFERDALVSATARNKKRALRYVDELAPRGGTAIDDALATSLELLGKDQRLKMILFATDGKPTIGERSPEKILDRMQKANGSKARLFVFGAGHGVNTKLLDFLALGSRGTSEYILPKEDITKKISAYFDRIGSPVMTDLTVSIDGANDVFPCTIPDIYRGEQVILHGRYSGPAGKRKVVLRGNFAGKQRSFVYTLDFPEQTDDRNAFVPRLWAGQMVDHLLQKIRRAGKEDPKLVRELIWLARRYGIVTPYTSFLMVEDNADQTLAKQTKTFTRNLRGKASGLLAPGNDEGEAALTNAWQNARNRSNLGRNGGASNMYAQAADGLRQEGRRGKSLAAVRYVGNQTFYNNNDTWFDARYDRSKRGKLERVKIGSPRYLALLKNNPRSAKYLAQGNVVLNLRGKWYDVRP